MLRRHGHGILKLGGTVQRCPGSEGVHVVSPMHDFSTLNCHDRDEPVVIRLTSRKYLAMHFIFEDYDTAILRVMDNKGIARVKLDRPPISGEAGHQIGSPLNRHRPTWEVIAGLENCVFGKRIEK